MPSQFVIRDCLGRVDADALDQALDGKTMKGAVEADGQQTHIASLVGHDSGRCLAPKKSVP